MKKLFLIASAIITLASCSKAKEDICGESTFQFKNHDRTATFEAYMNRQYKGEFVDLVVIKSKPSRNYIEIRKIITPTNYQIVFADTINFEPCKDIFTYRY